MELISAPEILSGRATSVAGELRNHSLHKRVKCLEPEVILQLSLSPSPSLDPGVPPCTRWVAVKAEVVMKIQSPLPTGTLPSLLEEDTVFQVNLLREIHLAGDSGENQSFLAAVREWKFDFTVKASWPQQGRIQSVCSVCGHDHLALGTGQLRPRCPPTPSFLS